MVLTTILVCVAVLTGLSIIFNWLLTPVKENQARMEKEVTVIKENQARMEKEVSAVKADVKTLINAVNSIVVSLQKK